MLRTIEKEKVPSVSLVGDAMLRPLIDALNGPLKGTDCSSLFSVSSSGAIMSETVRGRSSRALVPSVLLLNNFGSSESGFNGTATTTVGAGPGFSGSASNSGTARWWIRPRTSRLAPVGKPGRVAQRGHVPLGYYNDPGKPPRPSSGRIGERGGNCSATWRPSTRTASSPSFGRGSQCVNTGGEKVYPEEVEQALKSHPDVYDALVAGVPDAKWGHHVAAVVQLRAGADRPSLQDIQAHCASHLAGYKIPRRLVITDTIQRSPSAEQDWWARSVAVEAAR